jgi:hypothetical protein
VAVASPRRKKSKAGSGWSWRLAGIALCAFFVLGVITGLSQSGRVLARRIEALLKRLPHSGRSELIPAASNFFFKEPTTDKFGRSSAGLTGDTPTEAIALVELPEGFFQIDSEGGLRGPLSTTDAPDLPLLSGSATENASASQLVEYAEQLIRAEGVLSLRISEMRLSPGGEMRLFLDRPHLVIALTQGQLPLQLVRAAKLLDMWRGHSEVIGMIDMTIPGEAIVRPHAATTERFARANAYGGASHGGRIATTRPPDDSGA